LRYRLLFSGNKLPFTANYYQKQNTPNRKLVYFAKNSILLPQPPYTKPIGLPFLELQSVDSTNNYARQQIHAGLAQHGMTIFAHEQLSGKGQRGKGWNSEKNSNIILSILIRPQPLLLTQQFMLSVCVTVAIHDFFMKYAGSDTKIKWPNDLYWQDRKAGGVLIESIVGSRSKRTPLEESGVGLWEWSIVGIGININQTAFPSELPNPVSLKQITGKNFDTIDLAKELCELLNKNFDELINDGFENIYAAYLAHLYKINSTVKFKKDNRVFEATIKSVSPSGKLIVQHAIEEDPIVIGFDFGEVEWVIK
jgi:BirA family transcriptional regulator, biotin operon repressor / biotin---[acetyl-CoA-carboxylase] ligase